MAEAGISPAEMNRQLSLSHGAMHHAKKAAETGGEYELKGPKSAAADWQEITQHPGQTLVAF